MNTSLNQILQKYFGYTTFRRFQKEAIQAILNKKDALTVLPTGSGKSLIYQIPGIINPGLTLVFSPLISLMKNQVDQLKKLGIPTAFLNSTLNYNQKQQIQQLAQNNKIKILYIAPEGFFTEHFQLFLKTLKISLIAIDEAHCISEWGHDFRPEYRKLAILKQLFPHIPLLALTATATKQVQQDIIKQLNSPKMIPFIDSFERKNLSIYIQKKHDLLEQIVNIIEKKKKESGIIYCSTRKNVDQLSQTLNQLGYKNLPYHAGMETNQRTNNQNKFLNEQVNLIIATIAFGMGIDKSNIRYIIHANLPKSIENYYQEIGRAGRDGLPSNCHLLYSNGDIATQQFLIGQSENQEYQKIMSQKLQQIISFAKNLECRHKSILQYFGEQKQNYLCKRCDICLSQNIKQKDITIDAQKILSNIYRISYPVGISIHAQILAGSRSQKTIKYHHLPTFGIMNEKTQDQIKDLINNLLDLKFIKQLPGQYPVLVLEASAKKVLRNNKKVIIKTRSIKEKQKIIDYEPELFEYLRQWRKKQAIKENVPPYIIFSDKVLTDLAAYLPLTTNDLLQIPGIGQKRFSQYHKFLLKVTQKFCQSKNKTSRMKLLVLKQQRKQHNKYAAGSDTLSQTSILYKQGIPIKKIAKQRNITTRTVLGHICELIKNNRLPKEEISKFLSKNKEKTIRQAFAQIGSADALKPTKEILPDNFSYDDIRLIQAALLAEQNASTIPTDPATPTAL